MLGDGIPCLGIHNNAMIYPRVIYPAWASTIILYTYGSFRKIGDPNIVP